MASAIVYHATGIFVELKFFALVIFHCGNVTVQIAVALLVH